MNGNRLDIQASVDLEDSKAQPMLEKYEGILQIMMEPNDEAAN
jgi:hypothetical protein